MRVLKSRDWPKVTEPIKRQSQDWSLGFLISHSTLFSMTHTAWVGGGISGLGSSNCSRSEGKRYRNVRRMFPMVPAPPPRAPPRGECSISPRAAASASWPWPPPYVRAKLMHWQVWQSPSLWGLQNPRSDYPSLSLQLFVVLIFTRVIVLQNRTQHPGGDRWPEQAGGCGRWEGPEGALLTALGSTAACLCLILPQSWLKGTGGLGRAKEGLSVCEASTVPPTFRLSQSLPGRGRYQSPERRDDNQKRIRKTQHSQSFFQQDTHVLSHVSARGVWSGAWAGGVIPQLFPLVRDPMIAKVWIIIKAGVCYNVLSTLV